jgi:acyl-CoA dehydrogenase
MEMFMNLGLSHEQRMLVDTVQSFIRTELQPLEDEVEETGVLAPEKAKAIFNKSRDLGLYAMNIPEEFGGGGCPPSIPCWSRNSSATPPTS